MNPWYLPPWPLPMAAWRALPEYSWTVPTGVDLGRTWRGCPPWAGGRWVVGRYEAIPGDPHHAQLSWYCPAPLPEGATLQERGGWWVGQRPGFTMGSWDWRWVCRELWRHAGERMGIWQGYRRPALEQAGEGT